MLRPIVLLASASMVVALLAVGCPVAARCAQTSDCAGDDVCRDGSCESEGVGVGEGEGEVGEGEGEGEGEAGEGEGEGEAGEGEGEAGVIELVVEEGEQDLAVARGQRVTFTVVRGAGVTGACDVNGVAVNEADAAALEITEEIEVDGRVAVTATCGTGATQASASLALRVLIRGVTVTGVGAPGVPVQVDVDADASVTACTIEGEGFDPVTPFFLYAVTTADVGVTCAGEPGAATTTMRVQGQVFIEDVRTTLFESSALRFRVAGEPDASCTATRDGVEAIVVPDDPTTPGARAIFDTTGGTARYEVTCTAPGGDDVVNSDTASVRVLWGDADAATLATLPDDSRLFVAGDLDVTGVIAFDGTALEGVGGRVTAAATSLTALSLPALRFVGAELAVVDNAALLSLELPALVSAGALRVARNPVLLTLDIGALRTVSGALVLEGNGNTFEPAGVLVMNAAALLGVGGDLVVIENHTLPENVVSVLVTQLFEGFGVGGALSVANNGPPAL